MRDKFRGALVGVGVGDCLGAPFEGAHAVSEEQWRRAADSESRLRFTDDTHMTFAVAESLLPYPDFNGEHMAGIFIRDYEDEPWRGYGPGPPKVFSLIRDGVPWNQAAKHLFGGAGSFGNGAAMRVTPIALVAHHDLDEVDRMARGCASITHAHELGLEGAALQARAVALALSSASGSLEPDVFLGRIEEAVSTAEFGRTLERLRETSGERFLEIAGAIGNGVAAVEAVPAAICCFLASPDSFEQAVGAAVMLGGDTDTIASMTGAISGAYLGEGAIPKRWREAAEGASSLGRMADALLDQVIHHAQNK